MSDLRLVTPEFAMERVTDTEDFHGVALHIRKVSPLLMNKILEAVRREWADRKPRVPVQLVDFGNGPVPQENPLDSTYQEALLEWENEVAQEASMRFLDVAITSSVDVEVDRARLQELRQAMEAAGMPLLESDKVAFIKYLVLTENGDVQRLMSVFSRKAKPTPEAVQAHKDTFRPPVPGESLGNGVEQPAGRPSGA